jgi:hypothetical protein
VFIGFFLLEGLLVLASFLVLAGLAGFLVFGSTFKALLSSVLKYLFDLFDYRQSFL